jgi:hypothetical protein
MSNVGQHKNMNTKLIICAVGIFGGFWLAALISEFSLRSESEETQGRLLKGTASLRKFHLFGLPTAILFGVYFPNYALVLLAVYFALATILVAHRLNKLGLPKRLRMLQIASTATVFLGLLLGMGAAYVL